MLNKKIEQVRHFAEIINGKEQLASAGDVEAMFFLAEAYETGRLCDRDSEKVSAYLQMAKETLAGDLTKKYKVLTECEAWFFVGWKKGCIFACYYFSDTIYSQKN